MGRMACISFRQFCISCNSPVPAISFSIYFAQNHVVLENSVLKSPRLDVVTIVKSDEQTDSAYILLEVAMAPGGGMINHYHTSYAEEFIPIAGVLVIEQEGQKILLRPGRRVTAGIGQVHRFFNPGKTTIRFQVKITPGKGQFIDALRIRYGLAAEGKTTTRGIPRRLDHLALLLELSDIRFTGFLSLIHPLMERLAARARKKGTDKLLRNQYCPLRAAVP